MAQVLVVGPHPDDQELGMGGTIARLAEQGHDVLLLDMTNGEPTPFGDPETRARGRRRRRGTLSGCRNVPRGQARPARAARAAEPVRRAHDRGAAQGRGRDARAPDRDHLRPLLRGRPPGPPRGDADRRGRAV
ncbi:MAG: hypothetical protein HND58_17985 [Planctomycetota bacterium]|nr:MAG: hypothetical protein HND58_17985 [Planctomycetota bacterium]